MTPQHGTGNPSARSTRRTADPFAIDLRPDTEPVFELAVVCLDRIVGMFSEMVPRRRARSSNTLAKAGSASVTTSVGVTFSESSARWKPPGCGDVPTRRDEHVDDLPMLVHGAVHGPPDTVDLDVGLVHEPTCGRQMRSMASSWSVTAMPWWWALEHTVRLILVAVS
ncbi:hypothetical protein OG271_15065 [Micromonospora rifamycinica]|nr:hypothetical protein [Micromonospora rifamycinica]